MNLAADQVDDFINGRDQAAAKLTPTQREEVEARCKKWMEELEKRKTGP